MRRLSFFIALCLTWLIWASLSALSVREMHVSSTQDTDKMHAREKIVTQVLSSPSFYDWSRESLSVSIDHTLVEPRGRMKGRSITLSSSVARDSEFLKLFVHELGHFVDIYVYNSIGGKDLSNQFYNISWQSPTTKRAGQKGQNFISGYAATNQYEDFAESFVFYIFHNRVFEDKALKDETIRQKYLFFQTYIFPSGTFVDTDFSLGKIPSYTWDTTKLPISLQKYLYSLN